MRTLVLVSVVAVALPAVAQDDEDLGPGEVTAIQNRAYRPLHEINLALGVLPLDPYTKGVMAQASYTIHFTDSFAWQVGRGAYSYNFRSSLREQLERDFQVLPTAFEDEVIFFVGSDLMWTPFYGKLAAVSQAVIHGELFFTLGGSFFRFRNNFRPGVALGGGGRIFLSQAFSVRLDVVDHIVIPLGGTSGIVNVLTMTIGIAINFGGVE